MMKIHKRPFSFYEVSPNKREIAVSRRVFYSILSRQFEIENVVYKRVWSAIIDCRECFLLPPVSCVMYHYNYI